MSKDLWDWVETCQEKGVIPDDELKGRFIAHIEIEGMILTGGGDTEERAVDNLRRKVIERIKRLDGQIDELACVKGMLQDALKGHAYHED